MVALLMIWNRPHFCAVLLVNVCSLFRSILNTTFLIVNNPSIVSIKWRLVWSVDSAILCGLKNSISSSWRLFHFIDPPAFWNVSVLLAFWFLLQPNYLHFLCASPRLPTQQWVLLMPLSICSLYVRFDFWSLVKKKSYYYSFKRLISI